MNIDPKHALLKNFISDNKSGCKNAKTSIGQSLVSTAEQKLLDFELKNENEKSDSKKRKSRPSESIKSDESLPKFKVKKEAKENEIERDPLKLLKLF